MDLNKVMIIGRLTKNPEVRSTPNGQQVASFTLATNRSYKDASGNKVEKSEFHNIVAWSKLAEICGSYLQKGKRIYIEGRLQTRDWTAQDGTKRYTTETIAENMIMLDGPRAEQSFQEAPSDVSKQPPSPAIEEQTLEEIPF